MVCWWVMLDAIVATVLLSMSSVQVKMALCYSILDSVTPYVKSLGMFYMNLFCENVMGALDTASWIWIQPLGHQ